MLQQTQVSTVWPYYNRWMKTFPSCEKLASATLDEVLKLWEGLGYYSRARNIHRAAGLIVKKHHGQFPASAKTLMELPGIGPYTAAAIASMAYREVIPLIDGNVLRVFSRVQRIADDIGLTKTKHGIRYQLESLISQENPGAFNQALMDLGRVICTPQKPACENCPVSQVCQAHL